MCASLPDGRSACFVVKEPAPDLAGYRTALWLVPTDGSEAPRRLTLGRQPRRRSALEPRRPLAGLPQRSRRRAARRRAPRGQGRSEASLPAPARRAQGPVGRDLPHGDSPGLAAAAGRRRGPAADRPARGCRRAWPGARTALALCVVSGATSTKTSTARRERRRPPRRDVRLIDELGYQLNGAGFIYEHPPKLWIVEVASGAARRLTSGRSADEQPAWSPDGKRIAYVTRPRQPIPTWPGVPT